MTIQIHTTGPGMDDIRLLTRGQPQLVLGRGADCDVCLPDPQRKVSRHHLAVWCQDDELHFRVLSVVNGVDLPFGEAPPGACGVLAIGQVLRLGDYQVVGTVEAAPEDPWAALEQDSATFQAPSSSLADAYRSTLVEGRGLAVDDNPFSDWGFESTTGTGAGIDAPIGQGSATVPVPANVGAGDLSGLFRGLGLDPADIGPLSDGELEGIGQVVRLALTGLLDLYRGKMGLQRELGAEDRTMMAVKNNNPLKADWPVDVRLRYLLGGRATATGFIGPERALTELLAELRAHDVAASAGARAVVQGALSELSPAALKKQAPTGARLFESTRLWDAYVRIHGQEGADMEAWVQRLFERYFADTYLREVRRLLRESTRHPPGPPQT